MSILKGELARFMENSQEVVATRTVGTGVEASMADSIGIQQGDPEEDNNDIAVALTESTPNSNSSSLRQRETRCERCRSRSPGHGAPILPELVSCVWIMVLK